MSGPNLPSMTPDNLDSATARLTDTILGAIDEDLSETLKAVAAEIGLCHIAYLRLSPDKSTDVCLLVAVVTYSRLWQHRYFVKRYMANDPVISYGRQASQPFDWETLPVEDPTTKAFFADALNHSVGRNGLSIPLRNRRGVYAVVSFTSDLPREEWEAYKARNLRGLRLLSVLIDSAANINFKLPPVLAQLSPREEQCLLWAARERPIRKSPRSLAWRSAASKRISTAPAASCAA